MQLQTIVEIPKASWQITHQHKLLLVGSCFADEIGERFVRHGFDAMVNPFGTLYNPASIAAMLERCIRGEQYDADSPELLQDPITGAWHSWMHHSRFSSARKEELVERANSTLGEVQRRLRETDVLIVTLGTAIVYRLGETGALVANCHKQPDSLFVRERLSVDNIVNQWNKLIDLIKEFNPSIRIVLTVSPIRHKRDGLHVNQLSKAILLQAVDALPVDYFPSYEIMLDELRDYRFYAEDMIHPSALAVDYIWERFQQACLSAQTIEVARQRAREWARGQHRTLVK